MAMKAPNIKLDRVYINNKQEAEYLFTLVKSRDYNVEEIIATASIPEMELIHFTTIKSGAKFLVCKPKTEIHPSGFPALADVYCTDGDRDVVFFSTLVKSPTDGLGWMLNDFNPEYDDQTDENFIKDLCNETMIYYAGIQFLSLERPEVMATATQEVSYEKTVKKKGKYRNERRTKLIKVIRLDHNEMAKRHNVITCECWGVAGHWRTYKSGKQVFIQAYRKGKKRDDPNAYVPKGYSVGIPNNTKDEKQQC